MEIKNEGICRFCLKTFSGQSMGRHLSSCKVKQEQDLKISENQKRLDQIYHIRVWAYPPFWLHIETNAHRTLSDLDEFLRRIWLECCGHLSEFNINGVRYSGDGEVDDWSEAETTKIKIGQILSVKDKFEYVYDFGSSTYLQGQVAYSRKGTLTEKERILARNQPPVFECQNCDGKATELCFECEEVYCENCIVDHGCGEDMYLPVVNSPRMGECGYSGEFDFDDFVPLQ